MEPLASRILFVRNDDGLFEVGTIDQLNGHYVQTGTLGIAHPVRP
jgi:hypothetical protein